MFVLPIIKAAAGLATSLGAGAVIGNAIKATTPDNMKLASKILVTIGGVTLSSVAGDAAANYIENLIQNSVDGARIGNNIGRKAAENEGTLKEDVNVAYEAFLKARNEEQKRTREAKHEENLSDGSEESKSE